MDSTNSPSPAAGSDGEPTGGGAPSSLRERLAGPAQLAWRLLVVLALIGVVIWLILRVRVVVIPIVLAAFLAALGTPPAGWLEDRGMPPSLAATLVTLLGLGAVGGFFWFITAQIIGAAGDLQESVVDGWESFQNWLTTGPFSLGEDQVQSLIDQVLNRVESGTAQIGSSLVTGAGAATEAVTGFLLTIIVAFFMIKDGDRFWTWLVSKLESRHREPADAAGRTAWQTVRRYLAGTAVVGLADAVLIGIALAVVGVPLVVPLTLLVFAGAFFPLVGAVVTGAVAALVTLATAGFTEALIVVGATVAVQQIEGNLLQPLVMGRTVDLHPLVVIISISIGLIVAGLVGGFLAVPMAAVTAAVIRELRPTWLTTQPRQA